MPWYQYGKLIEVSDPETGVVSVVPEHVIGLVEAKPPHHPPPNCWIEKSSDGCWLTVYRHSVEDDERPEAVATYQWLGPKPREKRKDRYTHS